MGAIGEDPDQPDKPHITGHALIRPPGFEGRRAGETKAFTKKRQKNRERNKQAKASRRKR